jgi:hypothetical protein
MFPLPHALPSMQAPDCRPAFGVEIAHAARIPSGGDGVSAEIKKLI